MVERIPKNMRTTLKIDNNNLDNSTYIIELPHTEIGDLFAALCMTFTGGGIKGTILGMMLSRMDQESLLKFFEMQKTERPELSERKDWQLFKELCIHRSELCKHAPNTPEQ